MEMKMTKILGLLIALGSLNMTLGTAQEEGKAPIILLDPGHGGTDKGANAVLDRSEKDIVLGLAQEILVLNHKVLDHPMELYMTRYSDTLISLYDRGRLSKGLEADLFVSIHGNYAPNPNAQGLEVFVWRPSAKAGNKFKATSQQLAETLALELQQKLGIRNRGVKQANFQVLRDNRDQCPAVLVELGFLSNGEEAAYLKSKRGVRAMALAILMGINKFLEFDRNL